MGMRRTVGPVAFIDTAGRKLVAAQDLSVLNAGQPLQYQCDHAAPVPPCRAMHHHLARRRSDRFEHAGNLVPEHCQVLRVLSGLIEVGAKGGAEVAVVRVFRRAMYDGDPRLRVVRNLGIGVALPPLAGGAEVDHGADAVVVHLAPAGLRYPLVAPHPVHVPGNAPSIDRTVPIDGL